MTVIKRVVTAVLISISFVSGLSASSAFNDMMSPSAGVDLASGQPAFTRKLFTLSGINGLGADITLKYSGNVQNIVHHSNWTAPTGWVGLGWDISFAKISCNHQNTLTLDDDKYYIKLNSGVTRRIKKVYEETDGSAAPEGRFFIYGKPYWKVERVTREVQNNNNTFTFNIVEGWRIVNPDGKIFYYGEIPDTSDTDKSKATEYGIRDGVNINRMEDMRNDQDVSVFPTSWHISAIKGRFDNVMKFKYERFSEDICKDDPPDAEFTREIYIQKIITPEGSIAEFITGEKKRDEYEPPHRYRPDMDNYVQQYPTRYLQRVNIYDEGSEGGQNPDIIRRFEICYDFIGTKKRYTKRIPYLITEFVHDGSGFEAINKWNFEYFDDQEVEDSEEEVNYGAVKKVVNNNCGETIYEYRKVELNTSREVEKDLVFEGNSLVELPNGTKGNYSVYTDGSTNISNNSFIINKDWMKDKIWLENMYVKTTINGKMYEKTIDLREKFTDRTQTGNNVPLFPYFANVDMVTVSCHLDRFVMILKRAYSTTVVAIWEWTGQEWSNTYLSEVPNSGSWTNKEVYVDEFGNRHNNGLTWNPSEKTYNWSKTDNDDHRNANSYMKNLIPYQGKNYILLHGMDDHIIDENMLNSDMKITHNDKYYLLQKTKSTSDGHTRWRWNKSIGNNYRKTPFSGEHNGLTIYPSKDFYLIKGGDQYRNFDLFKWNKRSNDWDRLWNDKEFKYERRRLVPKLSFPFFWIKKIKRAAGNDEEVGACVGDNFLGIWHGKHGDICRIYNFTGRSTGDANKDLQKFYGPAPVSGNRRDEKTMVAGDDFIVIQGGRKGRSAWVYSWTGRDWGRRYGNDNWRKCTFLAKYKQDRRFKKSRGSSSENKIYAGPDYFVKVGGWNGHLIWIVDKEIDVDNNRHGFDKSDISTFRMSHDGDDMEIGEVYCGKNFILVSHEADHHGDYGYVDIFYRDESKRSSSNNWKRIRKNENLGWINLYDRSYWTDMQLWKVKSRYVSIAGNNAVMYTKDMTDDQMITNVISGNNEPTVKIRSKEYLIDNGHIEDNQMKFVVERKIKKSIDGRKDTVAFSYPGRNYNFTNRCVTNDEVEIMSGNKLTKVRYSDGRKTTPGAESNGSEYLQALSGKPLSLYTYNMKKSLKSNGEGYEYEPKELRKKILNYYSIVTDDGIPAGYNSTNGFELKEYNDAFTDMLPLTNTVKSTLNSDGMEKITTYEFYDLLKNVQKNKTVTRTLPSGEKHNMTTSFNYLINGKQETNPSPVLPRDELIENNIYGIMASESTYVYKQSDGKPQDPIGIKKYYWKKKGDVRKYYPHYTEEGNSDFTETREKEKVNKVSSNGTPIEIVSPEGIINSYLLNKTETKKYADIVNSSLDAVSVLPNEYELFKDANDKNILPCSWEYTGNQPQVVSAKFPIRKGYNFEPATEISNVFNYKAINENYVVSLWASNPADVQETKIEIELKQGGKWIVIPFDVSSNNWKGYETVVQMQEKDFFDGDMDVTVKFENDINIAEIRIYPENAYMKTYLYETKYGNQYATISANNNLSDITEYDYAGRIASVKTNEGLLLEKNIYNKRQCDCNNKNNYLEKLSIKVENNEKIDFEKKKTEYKVFLERESDIVFSAKAENVRSEVKYDSQSSGYCDCGISGTEYDVGNNHEMIFSVVPEDGPVRQYEIVFKITDNCWNQVFTGNYQNYNYFSSQLNGGTYIVTGNNSDGDIKMIEFNSYGTVQSEDNIDEVTQNGLVKPDEPKIKTDGEKYYYYAYKDDGSTGSDTRGSVSLCIQDQSGLINEIEPKSETEEYYKIKDYKVLGNKNSSYLFLIEERIVDGYFESDYNYFITVYNTSGTNPYKTAEQDIDDYYEVAFIEDSDNNSNVMMITGKERETLNNGMEYLYNFYKFNNGTITKINNSAYITQNELLIHSSQLNSDQLYVLSKIEDKYVKVSKVSLTPTLQLSEIAEKIYVGENVINADYSLYVQNNIIYYLLFPSESNQCRYTVVTTNNTKNTWAPIGGVTLLPEFSDVSSKSLFYNGDKMSIAYKNNNKQMKFMEYDWSNCEKVYAELIEINDINNSTVEFELDFKPYLTTYSTSVEYFNNEIEIRVEPSPDMSKIVVNGDEMDVSGVVNITKGLEVGNNEIEIECFDSDEDFRTVYTYNIFRKKHRELNLCNVELYYDQDCTDEIIMHHDEGDGYNPEILEYTADIDRDISDDQRIFLCWQNDDNGYVVVNNGTGENGNKGVVAADMEYGKNILTVRITEEGESIEYTINLSYSHLNDNLGDPYINFEYSNNVLKRERFNNIESFNIMSAFDNVEVFLDGFDINEDCKYYINGELVEKIESQNRTESYITQLLLGDNSFLIGIECQDIKAEKMINCSRNPGNLSLSSLSVIDENNKDYITGFSQNKTYYEFKMPENYEYNIEASALSGVADNTIIILDEREAGENSVNVELYDIQLDGDGVYPKTSLERNHYYIDASQYTNDYIDLTLKADVEKVLINDYELQNGYAYFVYDNGSGEYKAVSEDDYYDAAENQDYPKYGSRVRDYKYYVYDQSSGTYIMVEDQEAYNDYPENDDYPKYVLFEIEIPVNFQSTFTITLDGEGNRDIVFDVMENIDKGILVSSDFTMDSDELHTLSIYNTEKEYPVVYKLEIKKDISVHSNTADLTWDKTEYRVKEGEEVDVKILNGQITTDPILIYPDITGTADTPDDYKLLGLVDNGKILIDQCSGVGTITLKAESDGDYEGDEQVNFKIPASSSYDILGSDETSVIIEENSFPEVVFTGEDLTINEGDYQNGEVLNFGVELKDALTQEVEVGFEIVQRDESLGDEEAYVSDATEVITLGGSSGDTKDITIEFNNLDVVKANGEYFRVQITSIDGSSIPGGDSRLVTIRNTDDSRVTLGFEKGTEGVDEATFTHNVKIKTESGTPPPNGFEVKISISGSAGMGEDKDYTTIISDGTLYMDEAAEDIPIELIYNSGDFEDKDIVLTIEPSGEYNIAGNSSSLYSEYTLNINDIDKEPVYIYVDKSIDETAVPYEVIGVQDWVEGNYDSGVQDGKTWGSAFKYLRDATDFANLVNGDLEVNYYIAGIKIAEGTYYPDEYHEGNGSSADDQITFLLESGIDLIGGYPEGGSDDPNSESYETILSGDVYEKENMDDNCQICYIDDESDEEFVYEIDGLVFKEGYSQYGVPMPYNSNGYGGAIYINGYNLDIRNSKFMDNRATLEGGAIDFYGNKIKLVDTELNGNECVENRGGAINCDAGDLLIKNSYIKNNTAEGIGGGISFYGQNFTILNSKFINNESGSDGGGFCTQISSGNKFIYNSVFHENTASNGGGCYISSSSECEDVWVINSVFSNNETYVYSGEEEYSGFGGGIYFENYSPEKIVKVINSTFFNNFANNEISSGDAIYMHYLLGGNGIEGWMYNTILWGSDEQLRYQNFDKHSCWNIHDGDPLFSDITKPAGDDGEWGDWNDGLSLQEASGCVNTGEDLIEELEKRLRERFNIEFNEDFTENERKVGQIDIGAYEHQ